MDAAAQDKVFMNDYSGKIVLEKTNDALYYGIEGSEANEDVGRRGKEIRERSVRKGWQDDWTLDRQATLSVVRGDYSGIITEGKPGYRSFRGALEESAIQDKTESRLFCFI